MHSQARMGNKLLIMMIEQVVICAKKTKDVLLRRQRSDGLNPNLWTASIEEGPETLTALLDSLDVTNEAVERDGTSLLLFYTNGAKDELDRLRSRQR